MTSRKDEYFDKLKGFSGAHGHGGARKGCWQLWKADDSGTECRGCERVIFSGGAEA
jgi:hypothetical protein